MANPLFNLLGNSSPNAFATLIQLMRSGNSAQSALQALAKSNPKVAEAMQLLQDKNPQQLERICRNLCAQKGMNYDDVAAQVQQILRG